VSEPSATLRIDGLEVSRGGHPVLHGISLEVPQGQVTTLLGPNGAGKWPWAACCDRLRATPR
jgi:ABC-type branched-subunit amino acid transport system ATPase component